MHSSPSTTPALPSPGLVNELIQGRLLPPSKVAFFSRLLAGVVAAAAAEGSVAFGGRIHEHTSTASAQRRMAASAQEADVVDPHVERHRLDLELNRVERVRVEGGHGGSEAGL